MTQLLERAFEQAQTLPQAEQDRIARQVLDAVESLAPATPTAQPFRTPGLGKSTLEMADDFDASLPDSFWLGVERHSTSLL